MNNLKIGYISDIHFDLYNEEKANKEWKKKIISSLEKEKNYMFNLDVLVVAGDISEHPAGIVEFFRKLPHFYKFNIKTGKDVQIIFVPGNHDLWNMGNKKYKNIEEKVSEIKEAMSVLGDNYHCLYRETITIDKVTFGGILGWYSLPEEITKGLSSDDTYKSISSYNTMQKFLNSSNDANYIFSTYEDFCTTSDMIKSCQEEFEKDCKFLKENSNKIAVLVSHVPLFDRVGSVHDMDGADFLYQFSPSNFIFAGIQYNICGHTHIGGIDTFEGMNHTISVLNNPLMSSKYNIAGKVNVLTFK